jgi:hypothetical protein
LGVARARACVKGQLAKLHSRPNYYGASALLWTVLPATALVVAWLVAEPMVISNAVYKSLPESVQAESPAVQTLTMGTIDAVAHGLRFLTPTEISNARAGKADMVQLLQSKGIALAAAPRPFMINAAILQNAMADASRQMVTIGGLALALLGLAVGYLRINPARRARNGVERVMLVGIAAASTVAILTTAGIVLSMLFETLHFFSHVAPLDFFFGTVWDPRFSALGAPAEQRASSACCRCCGVRPIFPSSRFRSPCPWGCSRRSICPNTPARPCAPSSNRCSRSWPASRPSFTASSRSSPSGRSCATSAPRSGSAFGDQRADGGLHHGRHADPIRFLAVRRHHQRRAAVVA